MNNVENHPKSGKCSICESFVNDKTAYHGCGVLYVVCWVGDDESLEHELIFSPELGIFALDPERAAIEYVCNNDVLSRHVIRKDYVAKFYVSSNTKKYFVAVKKGNSQDPFFTEKTETTEEPHPYFSRQYDKSISNAATKLVTYFNKIGKPLDLSARADMLRVMRSEGGHLIK